jgi:hypothetical protein
MFCEAAEAQVRLLHSKHPISKRCWQVDKAGICSPSPGLIEKKYIQLTL